MLGIAHNMNHHIKHTSDVGSDGILSCDCGTNDKDSQASSCDCPVQIRKIRVISTYLSKLHSLYKYLYLYVQPFVIGYILYSHNILYTEM